jgi:hypothetical protein
MPPLTAIRQDSQELDRIAVREIVRIIRAGPGFGDGRTTGWIQPQLLVFASSVASRAGKEVHQPGE